MKPPPPTRAPAEAGNFVIGSSKTLASASTRYDTLASKHGVRIVKDVVASIDPVKMVAVLVSGPTIVFDKMILSPGVQIAPAMPKSGHMANSHAEVAGRSA